MFNSFHSGRDICHSHHILLHHNCPESCHGYHRNLPIVTIHNPDRITNICFCLFIQHFSKYNHISLHRGMSLFFNINPNHVCSEALVYLQIHYWVRNDFNMWLCNIHYKLVCPILTFVSDFVSGSETWSYDAFFIY